MFDPNKIFPVVRRSITKGSDAQVMGALTNLAKAHPQLNEEQALAALQAYQQQKQGQEPGQGSGKLSEYLGAKQ